MSRLKSSKKDGYNYVSELRHDCKVKGAYELINNDIKLYPSDQVHLVNKYCCN